MKNKPETDYEEIEEIEEEEEADDYLTGEELSGYESAIYDDEQDKVRKKSKKKRRRKKHPFLRFLFFCAVCVGLYFFARSDFFTITKIEVSGNRYYTKAQVVDISGLKTGYNLFETKTIDAKDALLSDPYIRLAEIKKVPRGTIKIDIEERLEYAAVPYGEEFILIDEDGMVLRLTDQEPVLPQLLGMTINEMQPGSALKVEQAYLLNDTLSMIAVMEESDLYFKKINFSTVIVRAYIYDNYYCEGTPQNIIENMSAIRQLVEEHYKQDITRGVIKVGKGNYLAFSPQID